MKSDIYKMFACSILEAGLFLFGLAQVCGTIADVLDGDIDDSVWFAGGVGILCLIAIVPLFKWSLR